MAEIDDAELAKLREQAGRTSAAEANKARLVAESNAFKERAQKAEGELSAAEEQKLKDEGKTNELLANSEAKNLKLEEKLKSRTSSVLKEKTRTEVSKFAGDAHNVDSLLSVREHKDLLKLDEESLSVEGAEAFVAKVRETHPFMFGKKKMPNNTSGKPPGPGDDGAHKSDEEKFRADLKTCKTRAQQKEIYAKYGKHLDGVF